MDIGFDPISAAIAAAALGFALWERRKRTAKERLHIKAILDVDDAGEVTVRVDVTNREPTAIYPDTFSFQSGDKHTNWSLGLMSAATQGIPSGAHWRHYFDFGGDPTEPYRWTLRLQDGRTITGGGHQLSTQWKEGRYRFTIRGSRGRLLD